jgi:hypothetical protein
LIAETNLDALARIRPAPQLERRIALQNHVVTDYPRQADVRAGRTRCWQQAGN